MSAERSLVLIKPDGVARREAGLKTLDLLIHLPDAKLLVFHPTLVPVDLAEQHYAEHKGKSFFASTVAMLSSAPGVIILVLEGPGIVARIRKALGASMVEKACAADPECVRAKYGVIAGVNITHASDAPETGVRETKLWMDYFHLKYDEAAANAAYKAYVEKYSGKASFEGKETQAAAGEFKEATKKLLACLEKECPEKEDAKTLLRIVLNSLL